VATGVLEEFRRRFVATAVKKNPVPSFVESAELEASRDVASIERNDRVLMFGPNSPEVLNTAARRAGSGSIILNVDDDPARTLELRSRIASSENIEARAAIRVVCAQWSDLCTDLAWNEQKFQQQPVESADELLHFKEQSTSKGTENLLIRDACVSLAILPALNVLPADRVAPCLHEVLRCLEDRGRVTLRCLVSDESLPAQDAALLNTCHIPTEQQLLALLEQVGFYGVEITHWEEVPRHVIQNVEVRSLKVRAFKGKEGPCYDCHHAVVYRGPLKRVHDDDGHVYRRGERTAVCEKTYRILTSEPYRSHFIPIPPYVTAQVKCSTPFDCRGMSTRDPKVTKGLQPAGSQAPVDQCSSDCAC